MTTHLELVEQDNLKMYAAIKRVRELHKETNGYCVYCVDIGSCCNPKDFEYPCPTIKALDGESVIKERLNRIDQAIPVKLEEL